MFVPFLVKSWADGLEDLGQGQKSLYTTPLLLEVDIYIHTYIYIYIYTYIYTKHEKDLQLKESYGANMILLPIFVQIHEQMTLKTWVKVKSRFARDTFS